MYQSTRSREIQASAKEAILQGLCCDGGLFVMPDLDEVSIPLESFVGKPYPEIAKVVFSKLLDDFTQTEIDECIKAAYFGNFENDDVAPIRQVGNLFLLELFHGPTSAFKDVALTMLPQLMSKSLKESGKKALILTATSGDTGKAAMSGFADVKDTGICVYYPHGGVSAVQKMQMATQKGSNVDVFAVKGNFDDAQRGVKELFVDKELNAYANSKGVELSSANSINIGRLIPQIVYYFSSYSWLVENKTIKAGEQITFCVPTGNFGDVLAGYYAHLMGLPVKKFIVASNKNDVLDDFIKSGTYDANREFFKTISPSMDILVSSNLERLLFYASNKDTKKVSQWMADLKEDGTYTIDEETRSKISTLFTSGSANEDKTKATIKEVFEEVGYVLDTHSAVAYSVALDYAKANAQEPIVCLSTASPYKFPQAVMSSLGEEIEDEWEAIKRLEEVNHDPCPANLANLKDSTVLHKGVIEKAEMKKTVISAIDKLANS